jgi:hypothetical protein
MPLELCLELIMNEKIQKSHNKKINIRNLIDL